MCATGSALRQWQQIMLPVSVTLRSHVANAEFSGHLFRRCLLGVDRTGAGFTLLGGARLSAIFLRHASQGHDVKQVVIGQHHCPGPKACSLADGQLQLLIEPVLLVALLFLLLAKIADVLQKLGSALAAFDETLHVGRVLLLHVRASGRAGSHGTRTGPKRQQGRCD